MYDITPVHLAAEAGHTMCLRQLLDAGALVNQGTLYRRPQWSKSTCKCFKASFRFEHSRGFPQCTGTLSVDVLICSCMLRLLPWLLRRVPLRWMLISISSPRRHLSASSRGQKQPPRVHPRADSRRCWLQCGGRRRPNEHVHCGRKRIRRGRSHTSEKRLWEDHTVAPGQRDRSSKQCRKFCRSFGMDLLIQ